MAVDRDPHNAIGPEDEAFAQRTRAVLDGMVEGLSTHDAVCLAQARKAALSGTPGKQLPRRWWLPVGGLATAAVMGLMVALWAPNPTGDGGMPMMEDLELLAAAEDVAFYEDLDFYLWLEMEGRAG